MLWWWTLAFAVERVEQGNLVIEDVPPVPEVVQAGLEPYLNVRSASFAGFSPEGGAWVITRFAETAQLHFVAEPGGARSQVTFLPEPVRGVRPSPVDGDRVLIRRDVGGDEQYQLWLLDGARSTQLSVAPGRVEEALWSPDGQRVAWVQTGEGKQRRVFVADPDAPGERQEIFVGDGAFEVRAWLGASGLLLGEYISAKESRLYTLGMDGRTSPINRSRKPISYADAAVTPDGRWLFVASDQDADFRRLWRFDLGTGRGEPLTADDWDVETVAVSPDGKHVAVVRNVDARSELELRTVDGFTPVSIPAVPAGVLYGLHFSPDSTRLGFTLNRASAPGDVYSFALGSQDLVRWTKSEVGGLDTDGFVEPTFVRLKSFDGTQVPAFVLKPDGDGPHPVVISIHGGPEAQARPWFSSTYQHWVNELGIAVVVPNVRGSQGYGRAYHQADDDLKRKDSVKDIGAVLDWIATQDGLDADRVAVWGGSYGGYMVLASLIDFPDRLVGGVDAVGISDFKTFLTNTKDYRRDLRRAEYGDERIPKVARFFDQISPLRNAGRIEDPLFVVQGANDPRVPASEAEQIVAAVREGGHEAWYLLANDEGHGFRKRSNIDVRRAAETMFWGRIFGLEEQWKR